MKEFFKTYARFKRREHLYDIGMSFFLVTGPNLSIDFVLN